MKPAGLAKVPPARRVRIRYRKSGHVTRYADFILRAEEVEQIRTALRHNRHMDRTCRIELKDGHGTVYAEIERTVYIAEKSHYRQRSTGGDKR